MSDVGTTKRRSMTATRQLRIWEASGGKCWLCNQKIMPGERWEVEHMRALALGGEDTDSNCAPAHIACHATKTSDDSRRIAKAKRQKAKHIGIKGEKKSRGWSDRYRRKMNGDVIDTRTGEVLS